MYIYILLGGAPPPQTPADVSKVFHFTMEVPVYEVAVLGAGVEGSATAYYLASRGTRPVLLLEQFDAGHTRGSSHGGSRITRKAYEASFYVKLMNDAYKLWDELEQKSGNQLFIQAGVLIFGERGIKGGTDSVIDALTDNAIPHKVMSGAEANARYPDQLKLPDRYVCAFESSGGILRANKAVSTFQEQFVGCGGVLRDNHRVTRIIPGPVVTVETDKTSFRAKRIIVTAGAWTNKLLQHTGLTLPLRVERTEVLYWKVSRPEAYSPSRFPSFIGHMGDYKEEFYGIPVNEYPGMLKCCLHHGREVDPDKRDLISHSVTTTKMVAVMQQYFKGVDSKPSLLEPCMYTWTPDAAPFLDHHPRYTNIVIGAGFSGHGFKLSPVVGKMLSELALGLPPSHDLSHFKISRFNAPHAQL